jgi:outer membrane protein assembly factor BamB
MGVSTSASLREFGQAFKTTFVLRVRNMVSLTMRRRELLAAVGAAGVVGDSATRTARRRHGGDWPSFQRDYANTGRDSNTSGPTSGSGSEFVVESEDIVGSPILAEGTLFVSTSNGVIAVDSSTGTEEWRAGPDPGRTVAPLLYRDGRVCISSHGDAHLRALDAATGDRIWMREIGRGAPAYEPTNDIVFLAGYGLDAATGEDRWRAQTSERGKSPPGGR